MHHIRRIPDAELPPIVDDDGNALPPTATHLLNMSMKRIGTDPSSGDGVYSVACVDPCPGHPGVELASGFLNERYRKLEPDVAAHVLRARVFRATDGTKLRETIERDLGITVAARAPLSGRWSTAIEPEKVDDAKRVLQEARRRAADERAPVAKVEVLMVDVADDDIVEDDLVYPMRWAGEISQR